MTTPTEAASAPSDQARPFPDQLRLAVAAYPARFKGSSREHNPVSTPNRTCAATSPGAPGAPWTRWLSSASTWSCTSGGCRKPAGSSPPPSPAGSPSRPGSTAPAPSTASWTIHQPSMSAGPPCPPNHRLWASPTCSSRPCSPPHASHRIRATSRWWPCSACGFSRRPARTSPTSARSTATGCCACAARAPRSSLSRCRQPSAGPSTGQSQAAPTDQSCSTAAAAGRTGTPPPAARAGSRQPPASRPPGHTRTCSATPSSPPCDAGVDLRDVQIAARHADPRTTMRYDRARQNLDRHPKLHPRRLHGLRHLSPLRVPPPACGRRTALPMSERRSFVCTRRNESTFEYAGRERQQTDRPVRPYSIGPGRLPLVEPSINSLNLRFASLNETLDTIRTQDL